MVRRHLSGLPSGPGLHRSRGPRRASLLRPHASDGRGGDPARARGAGGAEAAMTVARLSSRFAHPKREVGVMSGLRFRMRQAIAITGVALLTTAISCAEPSGQTQPSPSGSTSTITFTLTNSDCATESLSGVFQHAFVAAVVNTTSSKAA